jgi:hypothetical protein
MNVPSRANGRDAPEADSALFAILAALVVLLLLATNIQLWRLGSRDEAKGRGVATAQSALPPPVSGTSNDVLSKRLRRFSSQMTVPLNGLRAQLSGLQGIGGAQRDVATQIEGMSVAIRRFGSVRGEIGQMTQGLGKMVASTSGMSRGMARMGRDMGATRRSMSGMVKVMRRVEGGIASTSASSRAASEGIVSMRDATSAMAESVAANGREMTASLGALNERMSSLVEIFCAAFNSGLPACTPVETGGSSPTAVTPEPPAAGGLTGGEVLRQGLAPALGLESPGER